MPVQVCDSKCHMPNIIHEVDHGPMSTIFEQGKIFDSGEKHLDDVAIGALFPGVFDALNADAPVANFGREVCAQKVFARAGTMAESFVNQPCKTGWELVEQKAVHPHKRLLADPAAEQ